MLKWFLHKMTERMSTETGYDNTYLHEIINVSGTAALRFLGLPMLSQMRGSNKEIWAGSALGSVLDGDCGPCAQLVLDAAVDAGVDVAKLKACLKGDLEAAGDVGLGFKFALAAIADAPELNDYREEIMSKSGQLAVISASYAAATSRAYPVMKRGLGHGDLCQKLDLGGEQLAVKGNLSQSLNAVA